ncbi:epididymal-specific lipocalin-9 isoform X1 [Callithrix jacchus]
MEMKSPPFRSCGEVRGNEGVRGGGCSRARLWNGTPGIGVGSLCPGGGLALPLHVQGAGAPLPASSWLASRVQGECVAVAVVCKKTEKNGEYSINYEGENTVAVSETDYNLFITFHLHNFRNGSETNVLALYARVPQLEPSFLSRFEETCRKYGLGPQNIVDLTNEDHCYSKR